MTIPGHPGTDSSSARLRSEPRLGQRIGLFLKIGVAALLLYLVFSAVNWSEFARAVRGVAVVWLLLVAAVALIDRGWMAGKWYYLLRALGVKATFLQTLWHYLLGGLVGQAMQWQLGGDITRAVRLGHRSGQKQLTVTSLIFEKVVGAAANGLMALLALTLLAFTIDLKDLKLVVPAGFAICALAVATPAALLSPPFLSLFQTLFQRLPARWQQNFRSVTEAVRRVARLGRVAIVFFLLTLFEQIVPVTNGFLLVHAFGLHLTFLDVLRVMPITTFFSRLPISIEAVGVREGLYVTLFSLFGVTPAQAVAMALTARVIDILVVGFATLVGMLLQRVATGLGPAPRAAE